MSDLTLAPVASVHRTKSKLSLALSLDFFLPLALFANPRALRFHLSQNPPALTAAAMKRQKGDDDAVSL